MVVDTPILALRKALVLKPDLLEAQRQLVAAQLAAGRGDEAGVEFDVAGAEFHGAAASEQGFVFLHRQFVGRFHGRIHLIALISSSKVKPELRLRHQPLNYRPDVAKDPPSQHRL